MQHPPPETMSAHRKQAVDQAGNRATTFSFQSTLPADQLLLAAVMRRNEQLLRAQSLLTTRIESLEAALVSAHRYAHYDALTGLPNRRLLLDRFQQAAALATRKQKLLAILYFDLNDFKSVNDELGHKIGDELLVQFGGRLSTVIRSSDSACRIGGDEFVVLLTEVGSRDEAARKLKHIRTKLRPQYLIHGHPIRQDAGIGLAIWPTDAQNFNDLLSSADRAMFLDKGHVRRRAAVVPEMNVQRQTP